MTNEFCMPVDYLTNPVRYFDDTPFKDEYQDDIYTLARSVYDRGGYRGSVLDLGCGSGYKLMKHFPDVKTIGCDLPQTIEKVSKMYPTSDLKVWTPITSDIFLGVSMIISSDVLEHLEDPQGYLEYIAKHGFDELVLSTPNRKFYVDIKKATLMGPPWNPHHVREWLPDELVAFVSKTLDVIEVSQEYPAIVLRCRRKS